MLINLHDLKSRSTKAFNINNNTRFDFSDNYRHGSNISMIAIFRFNNRHKRFISMGKGYTNLVWDLCDWAWHIQHVCCKIPITYIYQNGSTKAMPIYCNWTCEVDMLELKLVCLLGTVLIVVEAFGPLAVSVVNAHQIFHKLNS